MANADTFIWDNDDPYIVISPHGDAAEPPSSADTSYALFDVQLLGGDEYTSVMPTVSWATTTVPGDTATADVDFQSSSGTVTLILDDEPATIQVPLVYDGVGESEESFRVALTGATNGITIMVGEAIATLYDAFVLGTDNSPDGQYGPVVGRTISTLSSDNGDNFWEGDNVTFTATPSAGNPLPGESYVWEWRRRGAIFPGGTVHHPWLALPGAGGGATANFTFSGPFIGQIRATLTSGYTVSSKVIDVRAKAAYPTTFAPTGWTQVGKHLVVSYAWASSSGRMADLDGVAIGEFVWVTDDGLSRWKTEKPMARFKMPGPPFDCDHPDGYLRTLPADAAIGGVFNDVHGNIVVGGLSQKSQTAHQRYWYRIDDGFDYWEDSGIGVHSWTKAGDPVGKQVIRSDEINYSVQRPAPNVWTFTIDKSTSGVPPLVQTVQMPLPWTAW
jgi:hypothetical protein